MASPRLSPDFSRYLHYQLVQHRPATRCDGSHRSRTKHRFAVSRASHVFISTGRRNISDSRRNRLGEMGAEKHFSTRNVDSFTLRNRRRTLPELPSTSSVKIPARTWSCPILSTCDRDPHTLVPARRGGAHLGTLQ